MNRSDFYKVALGVLLSAIIALLSYIAVTLKEIPVQVQRNDREHAEETRLREGRDESLQRQIVKTNDELEALRIEFEVYKAKDK
jgi:hypothetical protein